MNRLKLIILFTLAFSLQYQARAIENELGLRAGLSAGYADLDSSLGSRDIVVGPGFNTQFFYRFENFEFSLASYIYWGGINDLRFQVSGQEISGEGTYRHVSFGPMIKYYLKALPVFKNWHFYIGAGPSFSLQTVKIDDPISTGTFNDDQKLTYESRGYYLSLGIEEETEFKEMHPVYIEFLYSYNKSREVSLVEAASASDTDIISTDEGIKDLSGHVFMINFGIAIF